MPAFAQTPAGDPDRIGPYESGRMLYVSAALPEPDAPDRAAALLATARAALAPWTNATVRLYEIPGESAVVFAAHELLVALTLACRSAPPDAER